MSELPRTWARARLGDLTIKVGSGATPKGGEAAYKSAGTPLIRSMNVVFFGFKREGLAYLDDAQAEALKGAEVQAHDVLLNITGASIGRVTIAPPELSGARVNQHVCIIRPVAEIDPRFLNAYLSSPTMQGEITDENYGVTRQALTKQQILDFEMPIAPVPEQKRIADKLDALLARVDACRGRIDRVYGILKRFRQSVLAAATSGELTREWRAEKGLAKEWAEARVEEIASVGTGSTPLRSNSAFFAETGTPWITSAMTGLPFVTRAEEFVTDAAITAHRLKKYPVGTLLVAMYGEGKTRGQVTELRIEATINQACAAISVDARKATTAFVRLALEANYLQMRELAEGGNQPNLNLSKIKEFPLSLPCLEEQRAIAARVEAIYEWVGRLDARLRAAQRHVDRSTWAVLAKAFRGELVPQDPNDEPASALLARLKARQSNAAAEPPRKRPKTPGNRPTMSTTDKDAIKAAILNLKTDCLSFDELRGQVAGDYESLKTALFELLEEPSPVVRQVFDKKAKAMQFMRVRR